VSATAATLEAQAKVNLSLRVLAREETGYHQLETLFARIDLADTVRVATDTSARELTCVGADVGPMEKNLAFRAAEAYRAETAWPRGFAIDIEKRIPVGGGLGGGSADAGAVLRILNALAPKPLSDVVLATLAFRLGADIPFLATDVPLALAWGRGERLLALNSLPAREVLLCIPPFGVETAAAFQWIAEQRREEPLRAPAPLRHQDLDRWDGITRLAENDFETPVIHRHPAIAACLAALSAAGARIARMSGSGSTVFGVFDRRPPAELPGLPDGTRLVPSRTLTSVAQVRTLD
jgi:4-diphosphocytidyl-2-C-methyl-D-erythritol kinase